MVYGTRIEKGAANPLSIGFQLNTRKLHLEEGDRRLEMNGLVLFPATAEHCLVARVGYRMMTIGMSIGAARGLLATLLLLTAGFVSVSAQTPTGTFFNGSSSQLGNSLRSITFFLAAAMIIAGIIFVAVGIITSGLRESLSTWKFITGAACFAFGGICAAVYSFSQGDTVPLDNQF